MKPYEIVPGPNVASMSRPTPEPYKLPLTTASSAAMKIAERKGYEFLPTGGCGCNGGGCKNSPGSKGPDTVSWISSKLEEIRNGWGGVSPGPLPDWLRRDSGAGGGTGPGSDICRALDEQIQDLRREIPRRWRGISDSEDDRRRVRNAWEAAERACRFDETRSPCDIYTQLLGTFGDPNRNVTLYNDLNAAALRCGRNDDAFRRTEATGLGRVLRCILATNAARDIERDVARRRGASPQYRYETDIAPLQMQLNRLEALSRMRCNLPRPDPSVRPSDSITGDPPPSGGGSGGETVQPSEQCTLSSGTACAGTENGIGSQTYYYSCPTLGSRSRTNRCYNPKETCPAVDDFYGRP